MPAIRDLNKLNTFVRVAERRSFTMAARDLRMTPSIVSKHVSELEEMLGLSLLTRSTHGVALTEVGETFFHKCLHMLAELEDVVVDARNAELGPYGTLRIQATNGFARWFLAPLMTEFAASHPQLRVELVTEAATRTPMEDRCDAIVSDRSPAGLGLVSQDLGAVRHVVCASPAYFRAHGTPKRPQELQGHNCLVSSPFTAKKWRFSEGRRDVAVEVKGGFCSNSSAVLIRLALDGLGIVRLPLHAVREDLEAGRLQAVFRESLRSDERIAVYYSKAKHLPAKTQLFIDFLKAAVAPELDAAASA